MPAALEAARLVARQFDSYMEGVAVRPSAGTYVTVEPVSSLAISGAFEGDTAIQARGQFEAFMKSHDVPQLNREPAVYSFGWPRHPHRPIRPIDHASPTAPRVTDTNSVVVAFYCIYPVERHVH